VLVVFPDSPFFPPSGSLFLFWNGEVLPPIITVVLVPVPPVTTRLFGGWWFEVWKNLSSPLLSTTIPVSPEFPTPKSTIPLPTSLNECMPPKSKFFLLPKSLGLLERRGSSEFGIICDWRDWCGERGNVTCPCAEAKVTGGRGDDTDEEDAGTLDIERGEGTGVADSGDCGGGDGLANVP